MAYRVELSPRAFSDADAIVGYIAANSPRNATRWRQRLFSRLDALALMPRGCSLAPENEYVDSEIRQTFFGRYRILFTVRDEDSLVYVLTVRHGARRIIPPDELSQS
jgi:plasmid stabilization system protein ParE